MSVVCPVCDSQNFEVIKSENINKIPFGNAFTSEVSSYTCNDCGMVGDFANKNDELYLAAKEKAVTESVCLILDRLSDEGKSNAYIERSLGLPPRTLSRWKSGGHSETAIVLLRILATFPWIVEVAKNNYSKEFADYTLITQASTVLLNFATNLRNYFAHSTAIPYEPRMESGGDVIYLPTNSPVKSASTEGLITTSSGASYAFG